MCSLCSVQCLAIPKLLFIIILYATTKLCIKFVLCSIRNSDVIIIIFIKCPPVLKNKHKNKAFMKNP